VAPVHSAHVAPVHSALVTTHAALVTTVRPPVKPVVKSVPVAHAAGHKIA